MNRKRSSDSRKKGKLLMLLVVILAACIYYYVAIPAINIHASGFWAFLIAVVVFGLLLYAGKKGVRSPGEIRQSKFLKLGVGLCRASGSGLCGGKHSFFSYCKRQEIQGSDGSGNRGFCRGY